MADSWSQRLLCYGGFTVMETEKFISGYCRQLDASRMVEVVLEDGKITEVDCCYGSCVYQSECTVGKQISGLEEKP